MHQHLQSIYQQKYKNDANSQDLANALTHLIESIFGEPERLFYELLQNADDSASGEAVVYNIYLLNHYLVVSYNGRDFDALDLSSLCSVGLSSKTKTNNKIGYKGIGFKSVFGISDCVWIDTPTLTFRFDKEHNNQGNMGYPWQVIPIEASKNALPVEVRSVLNSGNINIVLELKSLDNNELKKIRKNLNDIYGNYKLILFLRKVKEINCFSEKGGEMTCTQKIVRRDDLAVGTRKLSCYKNGKLYKEEAWLTQEFIFDIPAIVRAGLQKLAPEECPEKLKNSTQTELTFAIPVDEDDEIIPYKSQEKNHIYCYLPTKIRKDLPFDLNGEFLTNSARTELLFNNVWNDFLFEKIGYLKIEWIQLLVSQGHFKYQIPSLIRLPYQLKVNEGDVTMKAAFNNGLDAALNTIAFLPEYNSNNCAKVAESVVDKTTFSFNNQFDISYVKDEIKDMYKGIDSPKILDPQIDGFDKIIKLGAKEFNIHLLCSMLERPDFKKLIHTVEVNSQLIAFFAETITAQTEEVGAWNKALSEVNFLLNDALELRTPLELYFPANDGVVEAFSPYLSLMFLNVMVYNKLKTTAHKWLEDIGVKQPTNAEIIRRGILEELLEKDGLTNENILAVTKILFDNRLVLEEADYTKLKANFKVLTRDNDLIKPKKAYLPDVYKPVLPVETYIGKAKFLSDDYIKNLVDEQQIGAWKLFLCRLGVQEKMSIQHWENIRLNELEEDNPKAKNYVDLFRLDLKGKAEFIEHYYTLTLMGHLDKYKFSVLFWTVVFGDVYLWENLQLYARQTVLKDGSNNQRKSILSFFQFYIQNNPAFPASDQKVYPTPAIYSKEFTELLGSFRPISALKLTDAQEEFLGVKRVLDIADILKLLGDIATLGSTVSLNQLESLYKALATPSRIYTADEKAFVKKWCQDNKILTTANSFELVGSVFYNNISTFPAPQGSPYFVKFFDNFSSAERQKIVDLFGLKILTEKDLVFTIKNKKKNASLLEELESKASIIAYVYEQQYSISFYEKLELLQQKLEKTTCYQCSKLHYCYNNEKGILIYETELSCGVQGEAIYYKGDWQTPETLYYLMPLLASYLDLGNLERELQLILMSPISNLRAWFQNKGLSDDKIGLILKKNYSFLEVEHVEEVQDLHIEYSSNADTDKSSPTFSRTQSDLEIGRRGEEFIYEILLKKYQHQPDYSVHWENEKEESKRPYDITIENDGEVVELIEVKTTRSDNPMTSFYLSKNELQYFFKNKEEYKIYRVTGIHDDTQYCIVDFEDITGLVFEKVKGIVTD